MSAGAGSRRPSLNQILGAQALTGLMQAVSHLEGPRTQSVSPTNSMSDDGGAISTRGVPQDGTDDGTAGSTSAGSIATSAGKSSRAKETHRQAEQRRRGQQIQAAMTLKSVLSMHEGTPLGVTLAYASEHIEELKNSEKKLLESINFQKRLREQLRERTEASTPTEA